MGINCSTDVRLIERDGVQWEVEEGAEEMFYQGEMYPSRWEERVMLWLPKPEEVGVGYLFSPEMKRLGERSKLSSIGQVMIDPEVVTTFMRAAEGGRGTAGTCCMVGPMALMGKLGGKGRVSRVHAEDADFFPDFPNLQPSYEPRAAKQGEQVEIFGETADRLHPLGALVTDQEVAVLWGDGDNEPRGFELVATLADIRTPRFGIRGQELLVIGSEVSNFEFRGYDEVKAAAKMADAARESLGADDLEI